MGTDDQRVVFLRREAATELLDLVDDRPGDADEDLLDAALEAIEHAGSALDADAQEAVARGDAVAVGVDAQQAASLATLIREDTAIDAGVLRSVGRSIRSKLKAARKKKAG